MLSNPQYWMLESGRLHGLALAMHCEMAYSQSSCRMQTLHHTVFVIFLSPPGEFWASVSVVKNNLPADLPNIVNSCSRHSMSTARLTSERPVSVIWLSETFLCWLYIIASVSGEFLKWIYNSFWCWHHASSLTSLPLHPHTTNWQIMWSLLYTQICNDKSF